MLKEIYEQPNGVKETLIRRLNDNGEIQLDDIKMTKEDLDKINKVYIVACGTAYHAGLVGKFAIEKFAKIPVITDIASELDVYKRQAGGRGFESLPGRQLN